MDNIHSLALCESQHIGENSTIGPFSHIVVGSKIGKACSIASHVLIENNVSVGDNVSINAGVQLWSGITLGNNVHIGANATFVRHQHDTTVVVQDGAIIGANATILSGITIGKNAQVAPGAVVVKSIPPNAIVEGNPAKITGYVNSLNSTQVTSPKSSFDKAINTTSISNVNVHFFPVYEDLRGCLSVGEFEKNLPFTPKRYFLVYDVMSSEIRGEHAHKQCHQFLICIKGGCSVVTDNGITREEIRLDSPNKGLHIPPMIWACQYKYTSDAVLLVFASEYYEAEDYIRNYDEFILEK